MATVFFRSVPTDVYQELMYLDATIRDLYLWMSLGPFSGRNGLVTFHKREPEGRIVGKNGTDDALGDLEAEGLVAWTAVANRRVVFLRSHG